MRFPSIKAVASELRRINKAVDPSDDTDDCDVRLCIEDDGSWIVRWGSVDYDPRHSPMCGASCVPAGNRRFDSYAVARDLLAQCRDQEADNA